MMTIPFWYFNELKIRKVGKNNTNYLSKVIAHQ